MHTSESGNYKNAPGHQATGGGEGRPEGGQGRPGVVGWHRMTLQRPLCRAVSEVVVDTWGMVGMPGRLGMRGGLHLRPLSPGICSAQALFRQACLDLQRPRVPFMIRQWGEVA